MESTGLWRPWREACLHGPMTDIYERSWPATEAKGGVGIVHGIGEHSGRYEHVASALNAAGYSAYALDVRGHGRSVGFPADMGSDPDVIINDVVAFATANAASHDRFFLLAHSMGTLITIAAIPKIANGILDGLILSGTATQPGPAAGDLVSKGAVPVETLSRDEAVQKAYTDDPLVWDSVPVEALGQTMEFGGRVAAAVPLIEIPVLLVHGVDDQLCDIAGAQAVHTELVITDKTLIGYEGLRHEILNEPEKDKVLADVVSWLDKH
jgi:acylglycerol lipase